MLDQNNQTSDSEVQRPASAQRGLGRLRIAIPVALLFIVAVIPLLTSYSQFAKIARLVASPNDVRLLQSLDPSDPMSRYYLIRRCLQSDKN